MFSKANKTKVAAATTRAAPSLISTDLEITGNINTTGEVQLDGALEGDIVCGKLTIGENAVITGQIEAVEVIVRGRINGRVRAGNVHLAKTARVSGDIWHDTLAIESGAFLDGHCRRNDTTPTSVMAPRTTSITGMAATASAPATVAAAVPAAVPVAALKPEAAPSAKPDAGARPSPVHDGAGNTIAKTAAGN